MVEWYIGLMSGTSLDGIDAALVRFEGDRIELLEATTTPFSAPTKKALQALCQPTQAIYLKQYGSLDAQLGKLFAAAVNNLLKKTTVERAAITAIGSHGQTIVHAPQPPNAFSLQIGDPNSIAELTGITTVADFRRRDIAVQGQGAPLVPAFHHAVFSSRVDLSKQAICVVNIGGIANVSYLVGSEVSGFDTGPGNTLIDYWAKKNINQNYDQAGTWAKSGEINSALLLELKNEPYFASKPPKSTGKELFSAAWLEHKLLGFTQCKAVDIQATLCQLTADTIAESILQHAPLANITLVCGGGVHNTQLLQLLKTKLKHTVASTAAYNINPDQIEAMAFAWLARQTMNKLAGNVKQVTGAKKSVILGGVYPSKK